MDRIQKFLRKLSPKLRSRVIATIEAISKNQLDDLDVKSLKGNKGLFRCRIGDIRIVFLHAPTGTNIIVDAVFRGKAYRRL